MKSSFFKTLNPLCTNIAKAAAPLLVTLLVAAVSCASARGHENPELRIPPSLRVPAGHDFYYRATGVGVQIYVWTINPTNAALSSWVFKAPHAVLFQPESRVVGVHFAGPTWQANDGSKVVGVRLAGSTVDPSAVPWLLLQAASTADPGIFANTTYIQRVNTVGGLAPTAPGSQAGQETLVPYVADYNFYRAR